MIGNAPIITGFPILLKDLTPFEIQQLLNIDTSPFSSAQWARLSEIDQNLKTTDDIIFRTLYLNPSRTTNDLLRIKFQEDSFDILKIWSPTGQYFTTGDKIEYWIPDSNHYLQANFNGDWLWFSTNPVVFKIPSTIKSFDFRNATDSVFRILTNGKIGIGTTAPSQKLEIKGTENTTLLINVDGAAANAYLAIDSEQSEAVVDFLRSGVRKWLISNYHTDNIFNIRKDGDIGAAALTILQNNNVGIGTKNQDKPLHIYRYNIVSTEIKIENDNSDTALGSFASLILKRNSRDYDGLQEWALTNGLGSARRWLGIENVTGSKVGIESPLIIKDDNTLNILTLGDDAVGIKTLDPTAQLDIPASTTAKASARIRTGVNPTTPNDGDIWRKIISDGINPNTDNFEIKTTTGIYDLLAPHNSGNKVYVDNLNDLPAPESLTYLNYSGQTGNFTLGELLTGSPSGATGIIIADQDLGTTGKIVLKSVTGTFTDADTITDPITGSADVDSVETSNPKILLQDKIYYFSRAGVVMPYTLYIPQNVTTRFSLGRLIYANADNPLFESVNIGTGGLTLSGFAAICSTGQGKLFEIDGSGAPGSAIILTGVGLIFNFDDLGTINNVDLNGIILNQFQLINKGITLSNVKNIGVYNSALINWKNNSTTMITVNGTNGIVNILGNTFKPSSNEKIFYFNPAATFESGIVNSNTLNLTGGGQIFQSGSKNQKDIFWTYAGNTNLPDSTTTAQGCAEVGTPITTLIPAISAQVILNLSTNWAWCNEERITTSTDGVATYNGLESITVLVDGNIELAPNLGTNQLLRTQFLKIHADDNRTVTFTNATNTINETATPRVNDDRICFYNTPGTLPTGVRKDLVYWVINKLTNSFQISYTQGGAAVTFPNDGTPPNNYNVAEFFGGTGRGQITNPLQFVPQSLVEISTAQQIAVAVWNDTTSNDIDSLYAYYRIKK